ncbi:MAG TPA: serine/threonine-protein kinase [Kofleriaceae bacterium]|nr:serine/threonine-protein kinase [Kofleriaceae bacterium]
MSLSLPQDVGASFGRYQLLEPIGAGGMAVVYRAQSQGKTLVIKRVLPELSRDPAFTRMLVAEARLSARLDHRGIVRVFELGRVGDEYYLAMEFVDGIDLVRLLNHCLQVNRPMPIPLACFVIAEVAAALGYAHALADSVGRPLGIVHRDISPSNVMVGYSGTVKLLDFGVAKAAEHVKDDRTRTGTLKGKINYLSPEQADGLPVDLRSDIFALGIVMHECVAMRRLFRAESDLITLRLVRTAEIAPPSQHRPEVSPELDRIVLKMLARDPEARYQSCAALLADLEPITRALGGDAAGLSAFVAALGPMEKKAIVPGVSASDAPHVESDMDSGPTPVAEVLSDFTGETALPGRPGRRRILMLGGIGVASAAALALFVTVGMRRPAAVPPPAMIAAGPPTPVAPPAPAPVPGMLLVALNVGDARIELDGRVVAEGVRSARVPLTGAGPHSLTVSAPNRKPITRAVTVPPGASFEITLRLERARSGSARPADGPRKRGENYLFDPFGKPR